MQCAAPGKAECGERLRRRFDEGEGVACYQRARGVVGGLAIPANRDWNATQGARDCLRCATGGAISFDCKNDALELWRATTAECLHWMQRTCGNAAPGQGRENTVIERATGVQSYFTAIAFAAEVRKSFSNVFECAIRSGDEEYISRERIGR